MTRRLGSGVAAAVVMVLLIAVLGATLAGCGGRGPVAVSRQVLGTVVTVTAYGSDDAALRAGADRAFEAMAAVEAELDPYSTTSTIAAFNAKPYDWHTLPPSARETLQRVDALGVGATFSPALFGVTRLYGFGGSESVPATLALNLELHQTRYFERQGTRARFAVAPTELPPLGVPLAPGAVGPGAARPGLDFGGAAKGLALDRAMAALRRSPGITGAMISTGSSTQVWGRKADGTPWRIGIEDPRATGTVVAVIGAAAPDPLNVSTSGDYQLFFERGGVRYHHILDPATGLPARGVRSLTVYGTLSGLDADILSTALFVAGPSAAKEWAARNGVGLYLVDARGRVTAVPAPAKAGVTFERMVAPTK